MSGTEAPSSGARAVPRTDGELQHAMSSTLQEETEEGLMSAERTETHSRCHLPHTVNGWPPQSRHQRLMSAARKVVKRGKRRSDRGRIISAGKLAVICYNVQRQI